MSDQYILGISAYYHDSAAALLRNGEIVAAGQEERFTRKKGDSDFPHRAIEFCLKQAGIGVDQLTSVGFYDKPLLKFERILETYLGVVPQGFKSFLLAGPLWIKEKLYIDKQLHNELGFDGPIYYAEHHESHAASAFFPSPLKSATSMSRIWARGALVRPGPNCALARGTPFSEYTVTRFQVPLIAVANSFFPSPSRSSRFTTSRNGTASRWPGL